MSVFLTGTDTGVGKTFTAVRLLIAARARGLRCAGYKPICCGDRGDAELLLAASSGGLTLDELNPLWLKTPASPLTATQIEQVEIDEGRLVDGLIGLQRRFDYVVVEGVGGWCVPLRQDRLMSDLVVRMDLPVLVVALNRLGVLNHTLLTVRSIERDGLECRAVVLNEALGLADIASNTNAEILREILPMPVLPQLVAETEELSLPWAEAAGLT